MTFSYFSLFSIQKILNLYDLVIFDVDELETHGGSLRIMLKIPMIKRIKLQKMWN